MPCLFFEINATNEGQVEVQLNESELAALNRCKLFLHSGVALRKGLHYGADAYMQQIRSIQVYMWESLSTPRDEHRLTSKLNARKLSKSKAPLRRWIHVYI